MAQGVGSSGDGRHGGTQGTKGLDEGYQGPATWPSLRRRRILRQERQAETRKSAMPKPALSVEGRVQVLEGQSMDEIARLNLYYTQTVRLLRRLSTTARWCRICQCSFPGRLRALVRSRPLSWRGPEQIIVLQDWARPAIRRCPRSAREILATAAKDLVMARLRWS